MRNRYVEGLGSACLAALMATGCAMSTSLKSVADSASSPFEWSSSLSGHSAWAYQQDVREQVLAFVESGGSVAGFERELGDLARRHGVLNWEVEPSSFHALGEGLREAGVSGPRLEDLMRELTRGDAERLQLVRSAYQGWQSEPAS